MENKSKPLEIKEIKGHIILLCKGYYKYNNILEALRMVWAIRCGYDYDFNKKGEADRYIANELYKLFKLLNPKKAEYFHEILHMELKNQWKYDDLTPLEHLILIYCSELMMIQIKEKVGKKWKYLIKLPKPKKQIFNRILRGNGKYEDYKLINN